MIFGKSNSPLSLLLALTALSILLNTPVTHAAIINSSGSISKNTSGLVGYWPFGQRDIAGITAYDMSGQGNIGTLANGISRVVGKIGQALGFDGSDDFVTMGNTLDFDGSAPFSIAAWVKTNSADPATDMKIVSKRDHSSPFRGYALEVRGTSGGNPYRLALTNTNNTNDLRAFFGSVSDSGWHYVVATYDGNKDISGIRGYVDGREQVVTNNSNTLTGTVANSFAFNIGSTNDTNSNPFAGALDEVRMYNRVLSPAEIKNLYNSSIAVTQRSVPSSNPSNTNGLVAHFPFNGNDIAGVTTYDRAGTNNGTLTAGPQATAGRIGQALYFNGNAYVDFGDPGSGAFDFGTTNDFSFSLWMKSGGTDELDYLLSKYDTGATPGYALQASSSHARAFIRDGTGVGTNEIVSVEGSRNIIDNAWHHIVATYDRDGLLRLYTDGTLDGTPASISTVTGTISNAIALQIAARPTGNRFSGSIDEFRIYNRVLSATEVKNIYNAGTVKSQTSQTSKSTNGLVGYWSFNGADSAGITYYDRSGQNNHATTTANKVFGKIGQALTFNGNNYADIGNASALDMGIGDFTVSAWTKFKSGIFSFRVIAGKGDIGGARKRYAIFKNNTGGFECDMDDNSTDTTYTSTANSYNDDNWHHIVCIRDGNVARMYIDGIAEPSYDITGLGNLNDAGSARIGALSQNGTLSNQFRGEIDEVRFYNRALSAQEIKALYNQGR
jgi:hypothetical protein